MKDKFLEFDSLICEKLDLLEKVKKISEEQSRLIDNEKFEELQPLIDRKQELIETINQLDKRLNSFIEKIKNLFGLDTADWLDKLEEEEDLPGKVKKSLRKLENIIVEMQEIDKLNLMKMRSKRMELGRGMMEVHEGRRVNKGYNRDNRIYSTFIDRKS